MNKIKLFYLKALIILTSSLSGLLKTVLKVRIYAEWKIGRFKLVQKFYANQNTTDYIHKCAATNKLMIERH